MLFLPQASGAPKPTQSRGAARDGGRASAKSKTDAAPVAKFKLSKKKGATPAVGKKLGGAGADEAEEAGEGGGAPLAEGEAQPLLVRVAQKVVAMLLAFVRRLLKLLFAPSAKGTAANQLG